MGTLENVIIRFTEEEYEQVKLATLNTNITMPNLLRCLWSEESKKIMEDGVLRLEFNIDLAIVKNTYKSCSLKFPETEMKNIQKIFNSVPMTPSNVIKYFILPRVARINKKGRWC